MMLQTYQMDFYDLKEALTQNLTLKISVSKCKKAPTRFQQDSNKGGDGMNDEKEVLKAFEECLCKSHRYCSECYQQGPGFGFVCRNNVCIEVFSIIQRQREQINELEHNLAITQNNLNFYVNGND